MDRNPTLCRTFIREAKQFFSAYPQVKHEWLIDDDEEHCTLIMPIQCEGGFEITVEVKPGIIFVLAIGAHTGFDCKESETTDELISTVLGLVRDLLSPIMRIRERLAGDKPYKWGFETYHEERWIAEEFVVMFFWNYFGKRTEKIYQNHILPARDNPLGE